MTIPGSTYLGQLYKAMGDEICRIHATTFRPPSGLDMNPVDFQAFRDMLGDELTSYTGGPSLHGLPVIQDEGLAPGEFKVRGPSYDITSKADE